MKNIRFITIFMLIFMLGACEAVEDAGEVVEDVGEDIQDAAE